MPRDPLRSARARRLERRIVWILGSPRSGSTWLLSTLAEHEAVIPVNEPLIGTYLGPFLGDQPGMDPEALDLSNFTLRRLQRDVSPQFFAEEFRDVWQRDLGAMIRNRLHAHALRHPARAARRRSVVIVKEPNGSQSADVIMGALPRSRLLFLLRDGRDVVDSELAGARPGSWASRQFPGLVGIADSGRLDFARRSALKWLWRTEVTEAAFAAHPGPKHLLRYEDLRADPLPRVRAVLDWLGLALADADLERTVARHSFEEIPAELRGDDQFARSASPGAWREGLSEEERAEVERLIGPKLRALGYGGAGAG
jgi:hypothetical protein